MQMSEAKREQKPQTRIAYQEISTLKHFQEGGDLIGPAHG
jgi:hypothetical protein